MSSKISAVILAGGFGTRMGGEDKGLVLLRGKPLIQYSLDKVPVNLVNVYISANRNIKKYESFGFEVIQDQGEQGIGPLGGIYAALEKSCSEHLVVLPCDTPFLPKDIVNKLLCPLLNEDYDCTVACTEDLNGLRRYHPTCMAIKIKQKEILKKYLFGGGRKIMPWVKSQKYYNILFTREHDFANLNTYKELKNLE